MQMPWRRRTEVEEDASSWQVPYADLMTLLLAVFVLIASVSDVRPGKRFEAVSSGLRRALGFGRGSETTVVAAAGSVQAVVSMGQRLEQAGVRELRKTDEAVATGREARYEVNSDGDAVIVRLDGADAFDPGSWRLTSAADRTVDTIGRCLAAGRTWIEIRGRAEAGETQADSEPRAVLELPYQRATAVLAVLSRAGVAASRVSVNIGPGATTVRGPLGAGRDVEIIIHAVPATAVDASPRKSS